MLARKTGFILVAILAMASMGIVAGIRLTGSEAAGSVNVAYAVLVKQAPFKTAGFVTFEKVSDTKFKVNYSAAGVTHAGAHPSHIHAKLGGAQCTAGPVKVDLSPIMAKADGTVFMSKTVTGKLADQIGLIVVIHDTDFTYMACGPIKAAG